MLCNGVCNGSALFEEISTGEGSAQSYKWSDGQGQVGPIASLLCAGTYTVTVTTSKGCEREFIGSLIEPTAVNAYINYVFQPLCFNDESGEAWVFASGGTSADGTYNYTWNKPGSHDDNSYCAEGVLGGNVALKVTVTDDKGCKATVDTMLLTPPFLNVLTEGLDPSCHSNNTIGNCDGTVTATGVGGTGTLFYQWDSKTFFQDTQTAIDLCGDEYCVTVTDANLCKVVACVTIEEPDELINTDTIIDRSTCKNSNGNITIVPAGGKGPIYSVLWSGGLQTGYTLSNVTSGTYCVKIVDGNNCEINECYSISDILGPDLNGTESTDITCFGYDDGTMVSELPTGGTPPYQYFWTAFDTVYEKREELAVRPGKYAFCVLDDNGCRTCDDGETILEPEAIGTLLEVTHIKCYNDCDGTASVQIVGGTPPYDVKWNADHDTLDVAGISKVTQGGLCANAYLVTVTDDAGCPVTIADVITEPAVALTISDSIAQITCFDEADGAIALVRSGGTGIVSYTWSSPHSDFSISGLVEDNYAVTVTDANLCTVTADWDILEPTEILLDLAMQQTHCDLDDGAVIGTTSGGVSGYTYLWGHDAANVSSSATNLSTGDYFVTVTDNTGCTTENTDEVTKVTPLTVV